MSVLLEFDRCPICRSQETASQKGCANEPSIQEGQFTSIDQKVTFLKPPQLAVGLSAPAIISHFDICAKCGHYYCTRVEKGNIPIQIKQVPGGPQGLPFLKG